MSNCDQTARILQEQYIDVQNAVQADICTLIKEEYAMKTTQLTKRTICILTVLCATCIGVASTPAADQQPSTVMPGSDTTTEPGIAAGSTEDTLQACMARIPKDASIGQLMIAEQGCWRDENDRQPFRAVPGARITGVISPTEHDSVVKSSDRVSMR